MLMLVVLSAGLITVLTGTALSQTQPAFADKDKDKDECEDNGDFNCNEETQKVHQEINCKVDGEIENGDKSDRNTMSLSSTGTLNCVNLAQNPEVGEALVDFDPIPSDPFALIP